MAVRASLLIAQRLPEGTLRRGHPKRLDAERIDGKEEDMPRRVTTLGWAGLGGLCVGLLVYGLGAAQAPQTPPPSGKTYFPVVEQDFAKVRADDLAAKPTVMQRQRTLLAERYDLGNRPAQGVMMSGGRKAVQQGVRVKLPAGLTWERLAAMSPDEIREKDLFPQGFLPLPRRAVDPAILGGDWDRVYGSLIFERTRPSAERLRELRPDIILGGTGWDVASSLDTHGIDTDALDYSDYPEWSQSIGFTQRGCRLRCSFCVVPRKEGAVREAATIADIWRGEPWPRHLLLLDNDFFGQPNWRARIDEIRSGGFKVSFNQGINARMLNDESAAAIASVDYRDDSMKVKRIYTAWDNRKDEARLFAGLDALVRHGVRPDHIMVYVLIGYWPGETHEDRDYRRRRLREFGARPYPMPFVRTPELVGFQRWVIGAYDKRIKWDRWQRSGYEPRRIIRRTPVMRREPVA